MDLSHCTTLLIDLTLGGTSPNFGWKTRGICAKVAFVTQNQRYLWNSLEPKLLHCVDRNSFTVYRLVTNLETYRERWPTSPGAEFFDYRYLAHFLSQHDTVGVWPVQTRHRPGPHCVRWGPSSLPPQKKGTAPSFWTMSIVANWSPISATAEHLLLQLCSSSQHFNW